MTGRARKHYDEPPLIEAVFELFADPAAPSSWNVVPVDRLRARNEQYAGDVEQIHDFGLSLSVGPHGVVQTPSAPAQRVRFWNGHRNKAVQFGPHMCAHNVLAAAYSHFEDHVQSIRDLFATFLHEARPQRLAWLGQRYINQIRIPVGEHRNVAEYFELYPTRLPSTLGGAHREIAVQAQTADWATGSAAVNLTFRAIEGDVVCYVLDVYARSKGELPLDLQSLVTWQERAHDAISESFEMSITDKTRRDLFKERP